MQNKLVAVVAAMIPGLAAAEPADLLVYQVSEPGVDTYVSRVIVTDEYLRIDEGSSRAGYMVFDRQTEVIYNVNPMERAVLVIDPPRSMPESPKELVLSEERSVDQEAPEVAGTKPVRYVLKTNGQVCNQIVTVDGVMPEAVDALREFQHVLAYQQGASLAVLPTSSQSDCDLSEFVFHTDRYLSHGLVIQEVNDRKQSVLVDFSNGFEVSEEDFSIPADFGRVSVPTPGGRGI